MLLDHPDIEGPKSGEKELHYFDQFSRREFTESDVLAYASLFPAGSSSSIRGEWTPRYVHDFWTPALLAESAPEAKLLVMLRDPIERYRSGLEHEADLIPKGEYIETCFVRDALRRSCYSQQLGRLLSWFPREQVLVLQYEKCVKDPPACYKETLEFLGVSGEWVGPPAGNVVGKVAEEGEMPSHIRRALRRELRDEVAALGREVPELDMNLWPTATGVRV